MLQQQAGVAMNQKHLLDAVQQAAQYDNFGVRLASGERLPAPAQAAPRKALLQRLAERLEHSVQLGCDGLANGLAEDGEQRVRQHARIGLHGKLQRFFDDGLQGAAQLYIGMQARPQADRVGQHAGHIFSPARRIVQTLPHGFPSGAIRTKQDGAQLGQWLRIARGS